MYQAVRWHFHADNFSEFFSKEKQPVITVTYGPGEKIKWEVEGKEFEKNGVLYDVVSVSKNDSDIIIQCHADTRETKFVAGYHKYMKERSKKNKTGMAVKKFFDKQIATNDLTISGLKLIEPATTPSLQPALKAGIFDVNLRPPDCCVLT